MRWDMDRKNSGRLLKAICKVSGCALLAALIAFIAVGPAVSGVINVAPGEASVSPSGSNGSVPLGAIAGFVALFAAERTPKTDRHICSKAPEFAGAVASSEVVRTSRGKAASVEVSGAIKLAEGCELRRLTYSVEDEHARFEGASEARLADDGSFMIDVPLQGVTKDNRSKTARTQYTITLFAEDEAGVGRSEAIDVMVHAGPQLK